ncbi:MAG: MotA/TolQ/ExbB proton channel family protein [Synechococcales bacterium]|nr:MotA/TolQ/ExbB proton channel family protein [Synechococcales bacterium]
MSTSEVFAAGGIVMWPLLLFSIVTFILTIERLVFWLRVSRRQRSLIKRVLTTYRYNPNEVFPILKQNLNFPIARIFLEALELDGASPNQFRLALEGATQAELPLLKRFTVVFQTIVAVSPLLGLLGTILGLIQSFAAIRIGEVGTNAEAVTGGISEALVSTAAGMVVAIFALLFANLFRAFYRRQVALLQEYGSQLEILYEWHYRDIHQEQSNHARIG